MHPYLLFLKLGNVGIKKEGADGLPKKAGKEGKGQKQGVLPAALIYQTRSMVETK